MEREQEKRKEIKEKRSWKRIETGETKPATTFSVAEEATIASTGDNRACSDGRGGEDECSGSKGTEGRTKYRGSSEKGSFCNGSRLE